jgi:hypothetical protein
MSRRAGPSRGVYDEPYQGQWLPDPLSKGRPPGLPAASADEAAADEQYNALVRMRPESPSPAVAGQLEARYSRLIEVRSTARARAEEIRKILGNRNLLDGWIVPDGEDE